MTPTAAELLSDINFLTRRMQEQIEYMDNYHKYSLTQEQTTYRKERYRDVIWSANHMLEIYRSRREELTR